MKNLWLMMAFLFVGWIAPVQAQTVVVAVSGTDDFNAGDILDLGQTVNVPAGARLTTLTKAGQMAVIEGPFVGVLGNTAETRNDFQTEWNAITKLFGDPDARSEVLGVSRDIEGDVPPTPAVWHISVDSSGPRCTTGSSLTLWRRNAETVQTVSVRSASASLKDLIWEAGNETLILPDTFSPEEGRLLISIDGDLRDLDLYVFPGAVDEKQSGALLGWLVEKNCKRQAWSLIREVHLGSAANH